MAEIVLMEAELSENPKTKAFQLFTNHLQLLCPAKITDLNDQQIKQMIVNYSKLMTIEYSPNDCVHNIILH